MITELNKSTRVVADVVSEQVYPLRLASRPPLRDYQSRAVDHLLANPRAALFLDLGLGKTRIALDALRLIGEYPVLVVAPLSVAKTTWPDEIAKWTPFKRSVVVGTRPQRKAALKADADVYIINRENVKWLTDNYDIAEEFQHLIIDESSSFKNPAAKRFRALAKPAQRIPRVTLLSGHPRAQRLRRPLGADVAAGRRRASGADADGVSRAALLPARGRLRRSPVVCAKRALGG